LNTILTEENAAPHEANSASAAGTIFGIERFSTRDGPGIRTTVFLKGCPLNCAWCHNPEGIGRQKAISFAAEFCIACGACAGVCQHGAHQLLAAESGQPALHLYDRSQCDACGSCVQDCPAGALEVVGRVTTVDEVMREVMQDRVFYARSGGGLTLSGGEPTAQIGFAVALLASAKREGLHCCVETSGFSSWANYARLLPLVDLFLFDFKESDPRRHMDYVGQSNEVILRNLRALHDHGANLQLQCPIVPGYNDREDHLQAIVTLARSLPRLKGVTLLPFHPLGSSKLQRLGLQQRTDRLTAAVPGQMEQWRKVLHAAGIAVLI
jgi:pyruvate formate lyase activating enzyme